MLPFLKLKHEASAAGLSEPIKREHDDDYDSLESAAEELINAVHSKDVKAVCNALRSAHELCDLEPHEEANHEGE